MEILAIATAAKCVRAEQGCHFGKIAAEGRVDILVNSAGVSNIGRLDNTSEEDFERLFRVNVKGVYLCMKAAIGPMKRGDGLTGSG